MFHYLFTSTNFLNMKIYNMKIYVMICNMNIFQIDGS